MADPTTIPLTSPSDYNASSIGGGFRIALDGSVPPAVSAATRRFEAALAAKRKVK